MSENPRAYEAAREPSCSECGDPLVRPEDIEEGMHFLCDPTLDLNDDDGMGHDPDDDFWDEGGEG